MSLGSNMFAAGFGDAELQWIIFSGMLSHPLGEDIAFVDNTLTTWSPRSVRLVKQSYPPPPQLTVLVTQPRSGIRLCSSHPKVSQSFPQPHPTPQNKTKTKKLTKTKNFPL
jgi:hypothetical protein